MSHIPVMLEEVMAALLTERDGVYIDATFGRGGYAEAILSYLSPKGRLIGIDKDWEAVAAAKERFKNEPRFCIIQGSFAAIADMAAQQGVLGMVCGVVMDLGVSSPQLDNAERGFSFMQDGPLDMRMDNRSGKSAADVVALYSEDDLCRIFREYGEERYAKRIARAIVEARAKSPIVRTGELAELVKAVHPRWEKHKHPATRVFQALRIEVNQELTDVEKVLPAAMEVLQCSGRLAVVSFHSLEDRIVKHFFQREIQGPYIPKHIPLTEKDLQRTMRWVVKAKKPGTQELEQNPRARSAVLRVGERIL